MNSRITAPMKARMMEPIMPPLVEIPSTEVDPIGWTGIGVT